MFSLLSSVGISVGNIVLSIASLLKAPAAPGLATLALLIALLCVAVIYARTMTSRLAAINWLRRLIAEADERGSFAEAIVDLDQKIGKEADGDAREHVAIAWMEYRETLVAHDEDGVVTLRNSVRPSVFFNPEDLHFGPGGWRTVPGLFVSIGLLLTFLGLIAALKSMDFTSPETVQKSLRDLLTIASAKFIMSLTGLFCSIVFTILLRAGMSRIEHAAHKLCAAIESRLTFISLEDLAVEQLRATREQRDHFRTIGMELVAELGRPLREELPLAITNSIASAMAPLIQQVGQAGADGMDEMVKGLSARFSDDVGRALGKASESLVQAGDRIAALSDRMDQSSGRVGTEIDSAVARLTQAVEDLRNAMGATAQTASGAFTQGAEQLLAVMNQTLEGIRDNTGEGARALSAAAAEMREAAQGFRTEIESASREGRDAVRQQMAAEGASAAGAIGAAGATVVEAFGRTSREISDRADQFAEKAGRELIAPLGEIGERIGALSAALTEGATGMRRLSDGVRTGAEASEQAASNFRSASQDLVAAVAPIRAANERIETAVSQLEKSTSSAADVVIRSSESTARSAAQTLAAAQEILGGQAKTVENSLNRLNEMLDRMKGQGERLDDIDEKLGKAFDEYRNNVATAVESLFGHVRKMQEELAPALDTMRAVVEQAEQFTPESRRRT
jgi:ABC-type transporter Mla subunit MlaD